MPVVIEAPVPTDTPSTDTLGSTTQSPSPSPTPLASVQPTSVPDNAHVLIAWLSETKTLEYIFILVLIFGGVGGIIYWRRRKNKSSGNSPKGDSEEVGPGDNSLDETGTMHKFNNF